MATLLQVTNKVLKRLREDTVATLAADYPNLVASFVADVVAELNELTIWNAYDAELTVSVVSGTRDYALTGTTNESMLLFTPNGMPQAWIFDSSTDTDGNQMFFLDPSEYYRRLQIDRDQTNSKPQWFTIEKDTDNDDLYIRLWPKPSATKYIRIRLNNPQAELDPDTDAAVEIKLPERVIRLGALMLAAEERGEEMGELYARLESRYTLAKGAAVENEIRTRERTGFYDWARN